MPALANALPTIFLRLADVFDRDEFDHSSRGITDSGIAAFTPSRSCDSADRICAGGMLTLPSRNTYGAGCCVHGQDYVWLVQQNTFDPGSGLSVPEPADCLNRCEDSANPGATAASVERHFGMESANRLVADLVADFTSHDRNRTISSPRRSSMPISASSMRRASTRPSRSWARWSA